LTADTTDGTCSMSPVSMWMPALMSSSVTAWVEEEAVTSPSASSVMVDTPSLIVASYAFVVSAR
jgi:hypothetical protein